MINIFDLLSMKNRYLKYYDGFSNVGSSLLWIWKNINHSILCLVVISLVGGALRFHHLTKHSPWLDERAVTQRVNAPDFKHFWKGLNLSALKQGAFYSGMYFVTKIFGRNVRTFRYTAAIFGTLAIFFIFGIGSRFFNPFVGLFASAYYAVSPLYIYYSQEGKSYGLLIFSGLASTYFLVRIYHKTVMAIHIKDIDYFAYLFFAVLTEYLHYFGLIHIVFQGLFFIYFSFHNKVTRRESFYCFGVIVASYLPFFPTLRLHSMGLGINSRIVQPHFEDLYYLLEWFLGGAMEICIFILVIGLAFQIKRNTKKLSQELRKRNVYLLLVVCACLPALVAFVVSYAYLPIFLPRYLLISGPFFFIILGCAANIVLGKFVLKRHLFIYLFLIVSIFYLVEHKKYYGFDSKLKQFQKVVKKSPRHWGS